jgi:hypothetical protein
VGESPTAETLGRQTEVGRAEADAVVAHRLEPFGDRLELDLGLPAEAFDLAAQVDRNHRPSGPLERTEEVLAAAETAFLILLARATAGFDVAVEFPGEHEHRARLRPTDEDPAIAPGEILGDLVCHPHTAVGRDGCRRIRRRRLLCGSPRDRRQHETEGTDDAEQRRGEGAGG